MTDTFSKDVAIAELAKALEKMTRAEIEALAKKYGVDLSAALEGEDLRKADLTDAELISLNKVPPAHLRDLARRLNIDPDADGAMYDLRKAAAARPFFVESFLAEPVPRNVLISKSRSSRPVCRAALVWLIPSPSAPVTPAASSAPKSRSWTSTTVR